MRSKVLVLTLSLFLLVAPGPDYSGIQRYVQALNVGHALQVYAQSVTVEIRQAHGVYEMTSAPSIQRASSHPTSAHPVYVARAPVLLPGTDPPGAFTWIPPDRPGFRWLALHSDLSPPHTAAI